MGSHSKEVNCPGCHGRKTVEQTSDGKVERITCPLCGGSGKQP